MASIFRKCSSLKSLPDISNWNTSNVKSMFAMFQDCSSLKTIPDISKWDTSKVFDMSYMFAGCTSLISLPDTSKWNSSAINRSIHMFSTNNNYGNPINVWFKINGTKHQNIICSTDMAFKELIKRLCNSLNILDASMIVIYNGRNIPIDCEKTLSELEICNQATIYISLS